MGYAVSARVSHSNTTLHLFTVIGYEGIIVALHLASSAGHELGFKAKKNKIQRNYYGSVQRRAKLRTRKGVCKIRDRFVKSTHILVRSFQIWSEIGVMSTRRGCQR